MNNEFRLGIASLVILWLFGVYFHLVSNSYVLDEDEEFFDKFCTYLIILYLSVEFILVYYGTGI